MEMGTGTGDGLGWGQKPGTEMCWAGGRDRDVMGLGWGRGLGMGKGWGQGRGWILGGRGNRDGARLLSSPGGTAVSANKYDFEQLAAIEMNNTNPGDR